MLRRAGLLLSILLGWSLLSGAVPARAQEVQWRYDYVAARKEAATKERFLLLDFGTTNCFWCRKLDAETFRNPSVIALLNEHFVPLKIDAQRDAALADNLRIQGYPTLVIAAPDGKILSVKEGFLDAAGFLEEARRYFPTPVADGRKPLGESRLRMARELLAQARDALRTQQYLTSLERCETLISQYADLSEADEARRLAAEIKSNPTWLKQACEDLNDRLGHFYLALAESWVQKNQPDEAIACLKGVVRQFPGTRHAEVAQARLAQLER
jgi:thioredoxin-related protein